MIAKNMTKVTTSRIIFISPFLQVVIHDMFMQERELGVRHCAYCLQLCGFPAKLCGGCKMRAYCSRECKDKDWSVNGNGQRHVNWCQRHEFGEEDVDWEVVPIPNKGLGVRAKKLIPSGFKIIVEPVFTSPNDHPGSFLSILFLFL